MNTQNIVQRLKDEGRREGRREGRHEGRYKARQNDLLTIYRARFGSVPHKVRAAVERTRDDAALARWVEIFVARSAPEILAAAAREEGVCFTVLAS